MHALTVRAACPVPPWEGMLLYHRGKACTCTTVGGHAHCCAVMILLYRHAPTNCQERAVSGERAVSARMSMNGKNVQDRQASNNMQDCTERTTLRSLYCPRWAFTLGYPSAIRSFFLSLEEARVTLRKVTTHSSRTLGTTLRRDRFFSYSLSS